MLTATAISAASSFVVLLVVAPALGPAGYASFSVYWAALFMAVGILFGVQQEATRAVSDARPATSENIRGASVLRFAGVLSAALLIPLLAAGLLLAGPLFGAANSAWAYPLAIAVAAYVGVAAVNGVLAGSGRWGAFAAIPLIDGILRLILVAGVLWTGADGTALAWAVAVPFPVSLLLVGTARWRSLRAHSVVDESYRSLGMNVSRTVIASTANAVLVNGFPVVLSIVAGDDRVALGIVILALTLTRAPILVPLTALQSMLIAQFSASPQRARRLMLTVLCGLAVLTPLLAAVAGLWGPDALVWLFDGFDAPGALLAWLVVASGCLGVLTVTGARVLAAGRHGVFATGWVLACALAIVAVAITPGDVGTRAVVGLIAGPLVGAGYHLVVGRRR
ncbi:hypothetical protein [Microbacterium sp. P03]|uniref:hypothetical protein n=1 Tax=Microbacterium sp. P03 TaxID=3366946 RepID=UPI00374510AD